MNERKRVDKIISNIKKVKIQGARDIALAGLEAYSLIPKKSIKKKLINARVTEPLLVNSLNYFEKHGKEKTLEHFSSSQEKINKLVLKLIKNNSIILTHCHSTTLINSLIYAKKQGRKFQVYNTETRPLFQGRITARELKKAGIKVTMFVDSASRTAMMQARKIKGLDLVFLGADAILKNGVVNKIGSGMIAEIAFYSRIPVYIIADSWKFTKQVKIEERDPNEVWKNIHMKIENPAFELILGKYIKAVVSELGVLPLNKFVKKATS